MKEPAAPRLGRGLAALLGEQSMTTERPAGVHTVPVEVLEANPFQPRSAVDPASLAELTESVRSRGILQPLLARPHPTLPGRYQIIAGERRWHAAQAAGLSDVPVLVRDLPDGEAMAAALVENLQRRDLNAIEEAEGYRRLIDEFGLTQEMLAQAVGKSRSHVANTMRLLNLPPAVRAEVQSGSLSAGHARALLAHPEPEKAVMAVISRGLNVRQTEALASQGAEAIERASQPMDPEIAALERSLTERLGLRVDIAHHGRGGSLRISYRSLDQLDSLIALLSAGH